MNKKIYLSGGGNEVQAFALDDIYFRYIPKNGSFLYIPIALRENKLYSAAHSWMNKVIKLHHRADIQFETLDNPSKYQLATLKEFTGIYIGGGNTWNLIRELKESGFTNRLIQYLRAGGQVYGGSAGAIIMGKRIDTQDDENTINSNYVSGINLLDDYSVACHFKDQQGDRFKKWSENHSLPIICLPEETGLIIENDIALCVGTKPCTIYLADGTRKDIDPEKSFNLKNIS